MKFFDRQQEIASLQEIQKRSLTNAQFTVLTGRRRVGKTSLVFHAYQQSEFLYFFVSKKAESELCENYQREIAAKLGTPILGKVMHFADIFEYVMQAAKQRPITLFIDEFQEFLRINPSVYSDMQRIWDVNKSDAHINLIVGGSVQSLIKKIFESKKEPLYNRQTAIIRLKPFTPSIIKEILATYNPTYNADDLLALYSLTGGVAKYVELLMDAEATTRQKMIATIVQPNSIFLAEGKNLLIDEFGKRLWRLFLYLVSYCLGTHATKPDRRHHRQRDKRISHDAGRYIRYHPQTQTAVCHHEQ